MTNPLKSRYLQPTPHDTKGKQFLTSLVMTTLFTVGVIVSLGLHWLAKYFRSQPEPWVQTCGHVVYVCFWLSVAILVVMGILTMLDWMLSTSRRPEQCEHVDNHHPRTPLFS